METTANSANASDVLLRRAAAKVATGRWGCRADDIGVPSKI